MNRWPKRRDDKQVRGKEKESGRNGGLSKKKNPKNQKGSPLFSPQFHFSAEKGRLRGGKETFVGEETIRRRLLGAETVTESCGATKGGGERTAR